LRMKRRVCRYMLARDNACYTFYLYLYR